MHQEESQHIDVTDERVMRVHLVFDPVADCPGGWAHTHGLELLGHYELEIRGIQPLFLLNAAGRMLNRLADAMVNDEKPWKPGNTVAIDGFVVRLDTRRPLDRNHLGYLTIVLAQQPDCELCTTGRCGHHPSGQERA